MDLLQKNIPNYFHESELAGFESHLAEFSNTYLVLKLREQIIGGIGYEVRKSDHSGRINWFFLGPAFQHRGFGKEAAQICIQWLKKEPDVMKLIVRTSQHAFQFFEKLGYPLTEQKKDYWAPGFDLYHMERPVGN